MRAEQPPQLLQLPHHGWVMWTSTLLTVALVDLVRLEALQQQQAACRIKARMRQESWGVSSARMCAAFQHNPCDSWRAKQFCISQHMLSGRIS